MSLISRFLDLFKKENRNTLLFLIMIVFVLLFAQQCNSNKNLRDSIETEQAETKRIQDNYDASQDSIKTYVTSNGKLQSEISGYVLTQAEFDSKYDSLFTEYTKQKNKKPKVIIQIKTIFKERLVEVPVYLNMDSLGNKFLTFKSDSTFTEGNSRKISGVIPYKLAYMNSIDSTANVSDSLDIFAKLKVGPADLFLEQSMKLTTGLSIDKETKKPIIWVSTAYPNVKFTTIQGANILDDEKSKKNARKFRREFGVGVTVGYGIVLQDNGYHNGIIIGAGVTYTPRFLQFGK